LQLPEVNRWLPDTKASVAGGLKQELHWQDDRWQGNLSNIDLKGKWNGFPLTTQGSIQGDEQGNWQFQQIAIDNGPNTLTLNGKLDKQWALVGKLRAQKLSAINPQWDGGVDGDFRLNGPANAPILVFRLAAPRIVMPGQLIREFELTGRATLDKTLPGQLQLHVNRWNIDGTRLQNVTLSLNGNAQQHQLKLTADGKQLNGALLLSGGWNKNFWQGQLQEGVLGGLSGEWKLRSPVALQWKTKIFTFKSHCWNSSPSQLCFTDSILSSSRGKIPFTLSDLNTKRLKPWLPDALNWQSALQANGILGWSGNSPDLSVSLRSQHGELITDQINTPYRDMSLQLAMTQKSAQMAFVLDSDMLGNIIYLLNSFLLLF
jgi:translocation and assembly module TamB